MAFRKMNKDEAIQPGQHWITTTEGLSGFFAVHMWMSNEDGAFVFAEPWDTGFGRYATKAEAEQEALAWAEEEDLPYNLDIAI